MSKPPVEVEPTLTLQELSITLQAPDTVIIKLIEHDIIVPQGQQPEEWRFDSMSLKRAKTAISFLHDLEVNMNGIALALDLLDRIDELERELDPLAKYFDE